MANGAERQQRLTGEAFQRLRNDHEQFLEAYESEGIMLRLCQAFGSCHDSIGDLHGRPIQCDVG